MCEPINPHDHAAWAAVDKYLEAQPLNYQDLDVDWSTAQYVDGQLHVNAIAGLVVPESVFRKPQEYMDELKEMRGRVLALSKENHQLKAQLKTREGDAHRLVDENHHLKAHLAEKSAEVMKFAGDVVKLEETVKNKDRAIEVLKETHGSLITEIAAQRDAEKKRADDNYEVVVKLQKQVNELKADLDKAEYRLGEVAAARDAEKVRGDIAVAQREEFRQSAERLRAQLDQLVQPLTASRYFTVVYRDPSTQEAVRKLVDDPRVAAFGWGHFIQDRAALSLEKDRIATSLRKANARLSAIQATLENTNPEGD